MFFTSHTSGFPVDEQNCSLEFIETNMQVRDNILQQ